MKKQLVARAAAGWQSRFELPKDSRLQVLAKLLKLLLERLLFALDGLVVVEEAYKAAAQNTCD